MRFSWAGTAPGGTAWGTAFPNIRAVWSEVSIHTHPHSLEGVRVFSQTTLAKVFQIHFWMQAFASSTPKRTTLVSNGKRIGALFNIACSASSSGKREHEGEELVKTCRAYVDGQGRKRYQGTPALKETQNLFRKPVHFESSGVWNGSN